MHIRFDLSRNQSLRTLETTAESMTSVDADLSFLRTVLSTVTSPLSLNIVIVYQHRDFGYMLLWPERPDRSDPLVGPNPEEQATVALHHRWRFRELHEMHMVRRFRLVLCADILNRVTEYTTRGLERVVNTEKAKGGFDYLHEPLIVSEVRSPRTRLYDQQTGTARRHAICGSAL